MLSLPTLARAAAVTAFSLAAIVSTGCGGSQAAKAQSPPPPSLSEPVRPSSSEGVSTANVVPADEYKFLEKRQVGSSTPLPEVPAEAPKAEVASASATADASGNKTYVMQKGDTLYGVARKFNVPPKQLIAANNFPDPNKVNAGTKVRIP
ncbi:MAG: LysM peptidoglycan-binding domain-containing protein [Planctomycetota bacterium]|nr:LysM peptidoglycan-binding domain-containing protein [Planctomycetota bacterium]